MKAFSTSKIAAILPEASLFLLMFGGVGYAVWGLGSHTRPSAEVQAQLSAHVALPVRVTPVAAVPVVLAMPAAPKAAVAAPAPDLESPIAAESEDSARVEHARELLGKFYNRSVVRAGEKVADIGGFIRQWTAQALKGKNRKYASVVAKTVMAESERNGFDPIFLMAVIENESSFDPHVVGSVGEIGLMQITPDTGKWIAKKCGIKWEGKKSLHDPKTNIRIGAAYLAHLREQFDSQGQLYLAAYNMGSLNVNRALERSVRPKEYPMRVMKRYIRFYTDIKSELKNNEAKRKPSGHES